MQSALVSIKVAYFGELRRTWSPVELTRSAYQRLVDELNPLTPNHLRVEKHELSINLVQGAEYVRAVEIIEAVVRAAFTREPNPDELRVDRAKRQLVTAA